MPGTRCQTNNGVDSGAKVCDKYVSSAGLYCKGCRERMVANGTWTVAHANRQNELNALRNEKERARKACLSVEKKEAHRARHRIYNRVFTARNRDTVNAAQRQRRANLKLDPVKYAAFRQKDNERFRKRRFKLKAERERKRARGSSDDDDDDDEDEKSTEDEKSHSVRSSFAG
jgi:hypothetical protein